MLPPKTLALHIHSRTMGKVGSRGKGLMPHSKQRLSFRCYAPQVGRSLMVRVETGCKERAGEGVWYALN